MDNSSPIVMSLGYNCEVSFRIEDYFGQMDSYIFSWSFEEDRTCFTRALENIDDVFRGHVKLQEDHMFRDEKYKIKFHPRYDILPKQGDVTTEAYDKALEELKNRVEHLKVKTKKLFIGQNKIIFILKLSKAREQENVNYVKRVADILQAIVKADHQLIVVVEKRSWSLKLKQLENESLRVERLSRFAPINHTDIMGDIRGWHRVIAGVSGVKSRDYYKNVRIRRRNKIRTIIQNRIKKCLKTLKH